MHKDTAKEKFENADESSSLFETIRRPRGMPERLVVIRHGESEANVINRAIKRGELKEYPQGFSVLPDREVRLSELGVRQAYKTGEWLSQNYPDGFDVMYVSDHARAMETAATICQAAGWEKMPVRIDPLLGERNWGRYAATDADRRSVIMQGRRRDPLHNPMPDGETLLEARNRSRELLDRCARQFSGKRVLVFSHGEYIEALWSEIAHMDTERQKDFFASTKGDLKNCQIVEFSSKDPWSETVSPSFMFYRSSCPQAEVFGEWAGIERYSYTADQLLRMVNKYPRLSG